MQGTRNMPQLKDFLPSCCWTRFCPFVSAITKVLFFPFHDSIFLAFVRHRGSCMECACHTLRAFPQRDLARKPASACRATQFWAIFQAPTLVLALRCPERTLYGPSPPILSFECATWHSRGIRLASMKPRGVVRGLYRKVKRRIYGRKKPTPQPFVKTQKIKKLWILIVLNSGNLLYVSFILLFFLSFLTIF